jgi:hypothetical protein
VRDEFSAPRFLDSGLTGPLAKQVELVFVERAFQSQKQSIITLPRRVYRFLIDEQRVYYATHLDQLLPISAVSDEPGDLACTDRADFTKADLGHHIRSNPVRVTLPPG